jgi:hypothetical protein
VTHERLMELVAEFDGDSEEEKTPLLYDMQAAGAVSAAADLARSSDPDERAVAARLMELLPDEAHLSTLGDLVHDPDRRVAGRARYALRGQVRTLQWRDLVARLAHDEDPDLASDARGWLVEGFR